jgi:hypothetical protein
MTWASVQWYTVAGWSTKGMTGGEVYSFLIAA